MLKALLLLQPFVVLFQARMPWLDTHITGLPPANLLFLIALLLIRREPDAVPGRGIAFGALVWFFAALTLAFVWSQLRAPGDFLTDVTYWKNAIFYPLFYFMYRKCRQDERTTRFLVIFILAIAALGGLQALREGISWGATGYNPARRASGPFGLDWRNANRAGVFYAMFLPMFVALALFLRGRNPWRVAAIGGCVVIVGGTLFTYSRQAYALVLLGSALLLLRRSLVVAIAASVALVVASEYIPESVSQRVEETAQKDSTTGEEVVDVSTASRWELWAGGMRMLADNPLGVGLFRFRQSISSYSRFRLMDAHNFYVLMAAEGSAYLLLTWLAVVWSMLRVAAFLRRNAPPDDPEVSALAIGFTVSTLCMALGGMYGSPNLEGAVMAPYWALAGLLERATVLRTQRLQLGGAGTPAPPSLVERFPLARYLPGHAR